MTTIHEGSDLSNGKVLGKNTPAEEIVAFLNKAPFVTQEKILSVLEEVPNERLEAIAKSHSEVVFTVYDVLLLREEGKAGETQTRENGCAKLEELFSTPRTPYSKWSTSIFRFTQLTLETAKKLSAVIRGRYPEVKTHEVLEVIRKLEQMTMGGFLEEEQNLALALLNVAALSRSLSPRYILHICSVLRHRRYPSAENTLARYFEESEAEIGECAVLACIKERREDYGWYLQSYLKVRSDRVAAIYQAVKEDLHELIRHQELDQAVQLLKPIYIHSTDELEQDVLAEFPEHAQHLLDQCQDIIWS